MRHAWFALILPLAAGCVTPEITSPSPSAVGRTARYARYQVNGREACGVVRGDRVYELAGDMLLSRQETGRSFPLSQVRLLVPTRPTKVLAMAGNYVSHLNQQPKPQNPELFFKVPSCLIAHGDAVVLPGHSKEVHQEGELVIVIGRRARNVPESKALDHVLGVTCGNDISARDWQTNDKQWWRAKGSDTFGPCGPFIVSGINYDDLLLTSRINGKVTQQQRTSDMVFNCAEIVSFASRHVTLEPGDLIYTGTMGQTPKLTPGDVLEVEIENIGVLRNPVTKESSQAN